MSGHEANRPLSDEELLDAVGMALDQVEPLPSGAVDFATGAFAWRDVDAELAELLHDSLSEETIVLRDETTQRLLVFQAGELTLDVEHGSSGLVGAISPPALYSVEVHDAGAGAGRPAAASAVSDESGMFRLPGEVRGTVRFVVSDAERRISVLSPWVTL